MPLKICVLVGSLREGSINRRLAEALIHLPQAREHEFVHADIGSLPLYSQDQDEDSPASVVALRELVKSCDAALFAMPEYNRSIPGVLKNAVDHGSRPWGKSVWKGKPAGVVGTSPGPVGTAIGQSHLRMVLAYLDMPVLDQPEAYIQWKDDLVAEDHTIHERSREFLGGWMTAYLKFVQQHKAMASA
jgi:chromate reductase